MKRFTTWGSVRGGCDHLHRTVDEAEDCVDSDAAGCARQGGYSDREVRVLASADELQRYDVTKGPGEPLALARRECVRVMAEAKAREEGGTP